MISDDSLGLESRKLERLKKLVSTFPALPGVYLMRGTSSEVLYVGKAKNLQARVRSYLGGGDGRRQIPFLMERVCSIDKMLCENEEQAILLERDLIQSHRPFYNIRLKDDKSYLRVRIDRNHDWPRLELVRYSASDGADYYGPYVYGYKLKDALEVIRRVIPLRTCSDAVLRNRARPCLEYQIKRCSGPCVLPVDRNDYQEWVDQAVSILEGRSEQIVGVLEAEMESASQDLRFEEAAALRDRINILKDFSEGHRKVVHSGNSRDAFGFYGEGSNAAVSVLSVRKGRIVGSESFSFNKVSTDPVQFIEEVIEQFYLGVSYSLPEEVLLPFELGEGALLPEVLRGLRGKLVKLFTGKRGGRRRLVELANLNASQHFLTVFNDEWAFSDLSVRISELLELNQCPRRIECLDISTLQGKEEVGGLVCFFDGVPMKSGYRRYRVTQRGRSDDYASIYEVVHRRLARGIKNDDLPDLMVIDGGKGQLSMALKARDELGVDLNIVSIAKIRNRGRREDAKFERIFIEGKAKSIRLNPGEQLTHFFQRLRDEAHRWVIEYHRKRRIQSGLRSSLESVPGIGTERRARLMKHFGSLARLQDASDKDIAKAGRMSIILARRVKDALR